MKTSAAKIKDQGGSCAGLFCPECALIEKCFDFHPQSIEEERKQKLEWAEEILNER